MVPDHPHFSVRYSHGERDAHGPGNHQGIGRIGIRGHPGVPPVAQIRLLRGYLLAVTGAGTSAVGIYRAAAEARAMQVPRSR